MAVITLISDMGLSDYYVAAVKGAILSNAPEANIVDITHCVPPFNIAYAGFILKNCYKDFPEGTVHVIGILPEADEQTNHLAILYDGHYFIGADNGIFSLIFDREPDHIVVLNVNNQSDCITFPTKTIFANAAAFLARGGTLEVIGAGVMDYKRMAQLLPTSTGDVLKGTVIHIDHYGNLITNVSKMEFERHRKSRRYNIVFGKSEYNIHKISKQYNEVTESQAVAIFGTNNLLEIAINMGTTGHGGGASQLFGINIRDVIRIEFE